MVRVMKALTMGAVFVKGADAFVRAAQYGMDEQLAVADKYQMDDLIAMADKIDGLSPMVYNAPSWITSELVKGTDGTEASRNCDSYLAGTKVNHYYCNTNKRDWKLYNFEDCKKLCENYLGGGATGLNPGDNDVQFGSQIGDTCKYIQWQGREANGYEREKEGSCFFIGQGGCDTMSYYTNQGFCLDIYELGAAATASPTASPTVSPTASPTASPTEDSVSAIEDPHVTNTRGEVFDVWYLGQVQFLRIPFEATPATADFVLHATIRDVASDWKPNKCMSLYITEVTFAGRCFAKSVGVRVAKPGVAVAVIDGVRAELGTQQTSVGNLSARPVFIKKPDESVLVNGKVFEATSAIEVDVGGAVFDVTAGKAHLNIHARNLLLLGKRLGGLLGEDDHEPYSTIPSSCQNEERQKRMLVSRLVSGDQASYSS